MNKPIVFFDLETTSADSKSARIVEFAATRVEVNGTKKSMSFYCNPEEPIPIEAQEIHKITNEQVAGLAKFKESAEDVADLFDGADIGTYNGETFDILILIREMKIAGVPFSIEGRVSFDLLIMDRKVRNHKLASAYEAWTGKVMDVNKSHGAAYDTDCTAELLPYLLDKYTAIEPDWKENQIIGVSEFIKKDGEIYFNFGKSRGELATTDPGYLDWMLSKDFSETTKQFIKTNLQ